MTSRCGLTSHHTCFANEKFCLCSHFEVALLERFSTVRKPGLQHACWTAYMCHVSLTSSQNQINADRQMPQHFKALRSASLREFPLQTGGLFLQDLPERSEAWPSAFSTIQTSLQKWHKPPTQTAFIFRDWMKGRRPLILCS